MKIILATKYSLIQATENDNLYIEHKGEKYTIKLYKSFISGIDVDNKKGVIYDLVEVNTQEEAEKVFGNITSKIKNASYKNKNSVYIDLSNIETFIKSKVELTEDAK